VTQNERVFLTIISSERLSIGTPSVYVPVEGAECRLQAAQTVDHPSEIALAWAILIQGALGSGDREGATARFESLRDRIDRPALSFRARTAVDRAIEQI
jgi:hypothetical protein